MTIYDLSGDVRALTVKQPYAACSAAGAKTIENRSRPVRCWSAPVLIHVGLRLDRAALRESLVAAAVRGMDLETGAVIAVARLAGSHPDDGPCTPWAMADHHHWLLNDIQPLPLPVPCTGALGLWRPPPHVLNHVRTQLTPLNEAP